MLLPLSDSCTKTAVRLLIIWKNTLKLDSMRAHCKWALMAFIPHLCHLRSNLPFSHFLSSLVPSKITQQLFPQCREAVRGQQGFVDRERSGVSGRVELTLDPDFFFCCFGATCAFLVETTKSLQPLSLCLSSHPSCSVWCGTFA